MTRTGTTTELVAIHRLRTRLRAVFELAVAGNEADNRQRTAFASDIEYGLTSKPEPILIDEWQEVPESLGHVKVLVDAEPRRGRFIITGSVRGDVDVQTWPGTGRVVRLEMYGLIEREIERRSTNAEWPHGVLRGDVELSSTDERLAVPRLAADLVEVVDEGALPSWATSTRVQRLMRSAAMS